MTQSFSCYGVSQARVTPTYVGPVERARLKMGWRTLNHDVRMEAGQRALGVQAVYGSRLV